MAYDIKLTRRNILHLGAGALAGASVLPRRLLAADAASFHVGVVTSLSGEDMLGGNLTKRGYDFWAETINAKGGIEVGGKRYKAEMFYEDDQSSPATGADAAVRLITREKVDVIFGPYTSGVTLAVAPICAKYQVPMIAGSAESPNVWKKHPVNSFGIIPAVDLTAGKSLAVIVEQANPKPKTLYVIGVNEPFSKETGEGFRDGAKAAGLELVGYDLVPAQGDLSAVVSAVAAKQPDVVAVGGHEEVLIGFVKSCKALSYAPKALVMHYGVTNPDFATNLGKDADGVLGITVWTPDVAFKDDLFGDAKTYAANFEKRYNSPPDYTAAACSVSGLVFQTALAKLGKPPALSEEDRVKLTALIADTDIETVYGPIKFAKEGDHMHDNTEPVPVLIQIRDGSAVTVGPANAKKADILYPLPAWNAR